MNYRLFTQEGGWKIKKYFAKIEVKQLKCETDPTLYLVQRLRKHAAKPPLPHISHGLEFTYAQE
jgi:hypothetical protein